MTRALWYLLTLSAATLWFGGRMILAALIGVPHRPGGLYDRSPRGWADVLLRTNGIRVSSAGEQQGAAAGPVVYAVNHLSFVDVWAVLAVVPGQVRFVAKQELAWIPFLGQALRAGSHIFIDRKDLLAAKVSYERAAGAIRSGLSALIFVEGTRARDGQLQPFKKGAFVLAIAAQVPVVPVWIEGTYGILPKGSIRLRPAPVTVRFGPPISTEGLEYDDRDGLSDRCREAMLDLAGGPMVSGSTV